MIQQRLQQLQYPLYNLDLTPCDSFVFPHAKKTLRDIRFDSTEAAVGAFIDGRQSITSHEWSNCFRQWLHRMNPNEQTTGDNF